MCLIRCIVNPIFNPTIFLFQRSRSQRSQSPDEAAEEESQDADRRRSYVRCVLPPCLHALHLPVSSLLSVPGSNGFACAWMLGKKHARHVIAFAYDNKQDRHNLKSLAFMRSFFFLSPHTTLFTNPSPKTQNARSSWLHVQFTASKMIGDGGGPPACGPTSCRRPPS